VRRFAVCVFAVILSFFAPALFQAGAQSAASPSSAAGGSSPAPSSDEPATSAAPKTPAARSTQQKASPRQPAAAKNAPKSLTQKTSTRKTAATKRRKPISPRVRRARAAFVASANLRPMAQQLLQDRTPTAYAGVEAYARRHAKEDAGALAWLVVGYAHTLDHDYAKAIDPFSRAKA